MDNESAARIRRKVSSGEFAAALDLWRGYTARLQSRQREGVLSVGELGDAIDLCQWTLGVAQCASSHARSRLSESAQAIHAAAAYVEQSRFKP